MVYAGALAREQAEPPEPPRRPERRNYARHARSLSARSLRQRLVILVLASGVVVALAVAARPAMRLLGPSGTAAPISAAARARNEAAAWVASWVADGASVGCDLAMCAVLRRHGLPSSSLWPLGTSAADPMNCDVIVATPVIRDQFGIRLVTVYAPERLASFGSASLRVDVRSIDNIGGTRRYLRAVRAGVRARRVLGRSLLGNKNISVLPGAARVLKAGAADPSLLMSLPVLARLGPITILRFARPAPGASSGMPVLSVDLTAGPATGGTNPVTSGYASISTPASLQPILDFLRAQVTPLRAAGFRELTAPSGVPFIRIVYAAPAPLNVFS